MGLWSSIKKAYTRVDRAVGGYLPGGVSPGSTSSTSSSTSSTPSSSSSTSSTSSSSSTSGSSGGSSGGGSSGGSTTRTFTNSDGSTGTVTTTNLPAQNIGGIIVTDFTTGESVTTKYNSGGTITSQTYSSAPKSSGGSSSSTSQLGQTQAIALASREGGLVSQQTSARQSSTGQALQPGLSTVSSYDYTGEPPTRYNRPLGSALGEFFSNINPFGSSNTYGLIGQKGFGAWTKETFFEPFEYVGQPKAYKNIGYNINPQWRGTEFGYGMPEDQKDIYTPEGYKDTTSQTWFDVGEKKKRELYGSAGLQYKGEPAAVLPQRIQEDVVKNLKPKYQEEYNKGVQEIFEGYQAKVNSGALTAEEAQKQFEVAAGDYAASINERYSSAVSSQFESRYSAVAGQIADVQAFSQKIFQPPAYPIIRGIGKGIETGAIVGATAFGGSGLTLAASAYLGYKTASQSVDYVGNFNQLTTGQKIIGGSSIALGALATGYTFNLGVTKFYGEWRSIIYSDLARSPARVAGKEVLKTNELTRYNVAAIRTQGSGSAVTTQSVDVYQTGADRVGFFSKGSTRVRIFDPQYEKYVTTTETFSMSGNIPNIQQGKLSFVSGGLKVAPDDVYSGVGSAIYSSDKRLTSFRFISGSQDKGSFYNVVGGRSPTPSFSYNVNGLTVTSTTQRGAFDSAGRIIKLQETSDVRYITSSGAKSSQQFLNNLYSVGGSGAIATTKQAQQISLGNLGSQSLKIGAATTGATIGIQSVKAASDQIYSAPQQAQIQEPQTRARVTTYQLPTLAQLGLQSQGTRQSALAVSQSAIGSLGITQSQGAVQIQSPIQRVGQIAGLKLKTSQGLVPQLPNLPGYFTPPSPTGRAFPPVYFNLNPGGLGLTSNIVKGGRRVVRYAPSFSAIAFNIRGSQGARVETGINFRPITPGFQFKTGLSFNLRKLRRFF